MQDPGDRIVGSGVPSAKIPRKFADRFIIGNPKMRVNRKIEDQLSWGVHILTGLSDDFLPYLCLLRFPALPRCPGDIPGDACRPAPH